MQPTWHIAFCNVTYTEYAGVRYADYYASPATMLSHRSPFPHQLGQGW